VGRLQQEQQLRGWAVTRRARQGSSAALYPLTVCSFLANSALEGLWLCGGCRVAACYQSCLVYICISGGLAGALSTKCALHWR